MTGYERLSAMLNGLQIDRPGAAVWAHCNLIDHDPIEFPRRLREFQESNDWDFIKMMYGQFHFVEDFDCVIQPARPEFPHPRMMKYPVDDITDWDRLRMISGRDGSLMREVEATKRIVERFHGKTPVLATVFSPFTNAAEMTGGYFRQSIIVAQARNHPEVIERALQRLTDITIAFCDELVKAGIDGVFFADQFASSDLVTTEEHRNFVERYDRQVLDFLKDKTWFNMVHVHGTSNLMMDAFYDYPVQALNWEDISSNLSLGDARAKTDKVLIGGIEQSRDFLSWDRAELKATLKARVEAARTAAGDRLIIAPGCAIPANTPDFKFNVLKEVMDELV